MSADSLRVGGASNSAGWTPPRPLGRREVPAFPVDVLPPWLAAFVAAEAEATQTPADLTGMLVLPVLAAASAGKVRCRVRDGFTEPLNPFVLVALPPASRKSSVFADVVRPVSEFEAAEAVRLRDAVEAAAQQRRILEARMAHAESLAARATGAEREVIEAQAATLRRELASLRRVVSPRWIVDECTPERLVSLLAEHDGRIALLSAEGESFGLFAGRYSQRGAPNIRVLLSGHAGDDIRVDRVGRAAEYVREPALTLGMAVQPAVVAGLFAAREFVGLGLLARFLYSFPESRIGSRRADAAPVPPDVRAAYDAGVKALLAIQPNRDADGRSVAWLLDFEPAARAALNAFHEELEPRLAEDGDLGHISEWGGKLVGAVVRLAGLLHMADCVGLKEPWSLPVPRETVERAMRLGHYLIPHALAAHGLMGADSSCTHARFVLERFARMGVLATTERDAFEVTKSRFRRVEELRPVLALLEEHGYLRRIPAPPRGGPGRPPSPRIELNPLWLAQRAGRAEVRSATDHSANTAESAQGLPA